MFFIYIILLGIRLPVRARCWLRWEGNSDLAPPPPRSKHSHRDAWGWKGMAGGWKGMEEDGSGWKGAEGDGRGWKGLEWDGMGRHRMGSAGVGRDGMGTDELL